MEGAAALRTDAREEAIELQVELGGLAVALALRGPGAPGLARALAVHRVARGRQVVPLSRDEQVARLALSLDCEDGLAPTFDALSLTPIADALRCEGDGLDGTIATDAAELIIHGGLPAQLTALRLCASLWLAPRGGLLLHGACVERSGRAIAFLGPSGAGKSTIARRLSQAGAHVVSDEVVAVRVGRDVTAQDDPMTARTFGHPFPRRLGDGVLSLGGAPLVGLAFLSQAAPGAAPSMQPLSRSELVRALLARVFLPQKDPRTLAHVLHTIDALARAAPAFALTLPDDDRAADLALSLWERA